jgi:hypothetical protein
MQQATRRHATDTSDDAAAAFLGSADAAGTHYRLRMTAWLRQVLVAAAASGDIAAAEARRRRPCR